MEWVIAVLIVVACLVFSIQVVRMLWENNFGKIIFMLACMELVNIGLKLVLFILTKMGVN